MNRIRSTHNLRSSMPGKLTILAALLGGLAVPAYAASDIVISQVYGAGGNGSGATGAVLRSDFIELFNRGTQTVSLNGWSVQYASATGNSWAVTKLTGKSLAPGKFLLIKQANGAGGTVELVPDVTGTTAMAAGAGKVLLSNVETAATGTSPSGATIVDLVGFGSTANFFEGSAPTATLGNLLSAQRKDDGCTDTDNNGSDFEALVPAPRNSATAARMCGTPTVRPIVASCPASLPVAQGFAGSATLTATDADGIVNGASIVSGAINGITLSSLVAAEAEGGVASVELLAGAGLPVGVYPIGVRFTNNQSEQANCTIDVRVAGLANVSHSIPQIQGSGATSPQNNQVVTTEGVLTQKVGTGFFIQDASGDGNPDTSDGLFIYTPNGVPSAAIGDLVRVTGTVTEFTPSGATRSYTELKDTTAIVTISSGHSITATNIELGQDLAKVEGMLVRFVQPLTISQTEYVGARGELTLSNGRLEVPTNRYPARTPEAIALAASNAANTIVLDDGIFVAPTTIPYLGADRTVRAGDTVSDLTGVIDFGAIGGGGAAFKLQPTSAPSIERANPRLPAPTMPAGSIKVASANVLNFFTTFVNGGNVEGQTGQGCKVGSTTTAGNCRGANNMAEFVRQRDKIVAELKALDADVVGLMEIQNNGDYAANYLASAINTAIGAPVYAVVPAPAATGTDAIRVAMLYKPSRVSLSGSALSDDHGVNNRPPMAQTFRAANGGKFSVIVNHLKSKGSCPSGGIDSDQGDSQSCWNATRIDQANRLVNSFVPAVQQASGDPDVLLIGDMNSYGMEDPIAAITSKGFVNELERFVRPNGMPYSYIFGGNSGYLDHALASASLSTQVVGAAEWHVNADEPVVLDYNLESKPQDLYDASAYRSSDHDPVVIAIDVQGSYADATGSFKIVMAGAVFNRGTGKFTASATLTNTSGAPLTGPFHYQLNGLPANVTLDNASGTHAGAPYVTLGAATLAPGASIVLPLVFTNPAKVTMPYTATVYRGTF